VHRLDEYFDGDLEGKKIAMWGLSFKPNTDDIREAPSHIIIQGLREKGAEVAAYDPEAIETTRQVFGDTIEYGDSKYDVIDDADALVICTEWHEFRRPDLAEVRNRIGRPLILDGRNLYEPERMAEMGFEYYSIGRPHYAPEDDQDAIREAIVENGQS
jgi:UDPglucose 6-dehydrogenase